MWIFFFSQVHPLHTRCILEINTLSVCATEASSVHRLVFAGYFADWFPNDLWCHKSRTLARLSESDFPRTRTFSPLNMKTAWQCPTVHKLKESTGRTSRKTFLTGGDFKIYLGLCDYTPAHFCMFCMWTCMWSLLFFHQSRAANAELSWSELSDKWFKYAHEVFHSGTIPFALNSTVLSLSNQRRPLVKWCISSTSRSQLSFLMRERL